MLAPETPPQEPQYSTQEDSPNFGDDVSLSDDDDEPFIKVFKKRKVLLWYKLPYITGASSIVKKYVGECVASNTKRTKNTSIRRLCSFIFTAQNSKKPLNELF